MRPLVMVMEEKEEEEEMVAVALWVILSRHWDMLYTDFK